MKTHFHCVQGVAAARGEALQERVVRLRRLGKIARLDKNRFNLL